MPGTVPRVRQPIVSRAWDAPGAPARRAVGRARREGGCVPSRPRASAQSA